MTAIAPIAPPTAPRRVERFEAIVIGAGQAGLATGYHLARHDVDFAIFTGERRIGDNWRRRWDSLRLFTPAERSGLPGMPFPAAPGHLPDKDETADFLERYAERFDLPVRLGAHVARLERDGERWVAHVDGMRVEAGSVVVATGAFQRPNIPAVSQRLSSGIRQLHSSEYVNPFALPDGPVLVAGAGNSGAQIALELARHRKVWLAGRDTGHLPRRILGRDLFDWIWPVLTRATGDTPIGRRIRTSVRSGGDALIGIPERALRDAGVVRMGKVSGERGGLPACDGTVLEPSVIVWCTGFRPDYSWIDAPVFDDAGHPRHVRGVAEGADGLHFVGLRFQHRLTSSLIGGVGADAEWIAAQVAQRPESLAAMA